VSDCRDAKFQGREGQLLIDSMIVCSRVNSTKSPASGPSSFSEPRLMCEVVCAYVTVIVQSECCMYLYSSAYVAGEIILPRWDGQNVCETGAESFDAK
jgi:hypothetical protein